MLIYTNIELLFLVFVERYNYRNTLTPKYSLRYFTKLYRNTDCGIAVNTKFYISKMDIKTKVITVTGIKGGIGKSTTAFHIAAYISRFGKTLLLDCDDKNRTSVEWYKRGLANDIEFGFEVADERSGKLKVIGKDFIVIDTPANLANDDFEELSQECDLMILPVYPDANSIDSLGKILGKIKDDAAFRGLISMEPALPNRDGEEVQKMLRDNGVPVFDVRVKRSVALARAAKIGCTVRDLPKDDKSAQALWLNFEELGKEVMKILRKGDRK